jgi:hypothetical protein
VNIGTGSNLFIYLEGGGGCWDEVTCAGLNTASYIKDGYNQATFEADMDGLMKPASHGGIFDRTLEANPFKDASFIFVPYCTGDVHAGDAVAQFLLPPRKMHFAGRKNIDAFLKVIVPAFPNVSRVMFAGSSAGGFGAAINYWRAQQAFGKIRVDLIDDSGPPFEQSNMPLFPIWKKAWNMDGAFPADCEPCKSNIAEVTPYYAKTYPASRFALLSYTHDTVISVFFVSTQDQFAGHLADMTANRIDPLTNTRYFVVDAAAHTMLGNLGTKSGSAVLGNWLTDMWSDSPSWANVGEK